MFKPRHGEEEVEGRPVARLGHAPVADQELLSKRAALNCVRVRSSARRRSRLRLIDLVQGHASWKLDEGASAGFSSRRYDTKGGNRGTERRAVAGARFDL